VAGHLKIVARLLDHSADPIIREHTGFTLHAAAQTGDTEMMRILLFNSADLNAKKQDGENSA
jgi:ankyrin repeat protein